jgi:hypothetical protein
MKNAIKCEYLESEDCSAISANEEAKNTREESCENSNKSGCCYLCAFQPNCEVSCMLLGEKKCSACGTEMQKMKMNLRVDGMTGPWMLEQGDFLDSSKYVLPVTAYSCPKCQKLEFFTQKKNA